MVTRARQVMIVVAACVAVADAKPAASPPEPDRPAAPGSGGSGGARGTQKSWPCSGCMITVPASYDPSVPAPLVVSLHGDEGQPRDTHGIWKKAAQDNGYILFSPKCPRARGCTKGFSRGKWRHDGPTGSVAWINAQIDAVEAAYNIDRSRIYMVGGSRGAIFIGFYAELLAPRIAGAALYAGGAPSAANTCAACALPVYVLVGDKDFLLRDVVEARDWFLGCGSEVMFDKLPKVRHRDIGVALEKSKASTILQWFSARPNTCRVSSAQ